MASLPSAAGPSTCLQYPGMLLCILLRSIRGVVGLQSSLPRQAHRVMHLLTVSRRGGGVVLDTRPTYASYHSLQYRVMMQFEYFSTSTLHCSRFGYNTSHIEIETYLIKVTGVVHPPIQQFNNSTKTFTLIMIVSIIKLVLLYIMFVFLLFCNQIFT